MTATVTAGAAPAGWYADPAGQTEYRYWDGGRWTSGVVVAGRVVEQPLPLPADRPPETPPTTGIELPPRALLIALLGFVVGMVASTVLSIGAVALGMPDIAAVALAGIGLWGGLLGACIMASRRYGTGHLVVDYGLEGGLHWVDLARGLGYATLARVAGVIALIPVALASEDAFSPDNGALDGVDINLTALLVFAVVAVIGAPIVEELFFRGLLLRSLHSRWSTPLALSVQAVIFAAAHLDPTLGLRNLAVLAAIIPAGAVLGFAALRRGLATSMIAHSLFNFVAVLLTVAALAAG